MDQRIFILFVSCQMSQQFNLVFLLEELKTVPGPGAGDVICLAYILGKARLHRKQKTIVSGETCLDCGLILANIETQV